MDLKDLLKRSKLWCITPEQLITILDWKKTNCLVLPILPDEIRGATIVSVRDDFVRRCFEVQVCREDWPEVLPGRELEHVGPFGFEQEVIDVPAYRKDQEALKAEFLNLLKGFMIHVAAFWQRGGQPGFDDVIRIWYKGYQLGGGFDPGEHFFEEALKIFLQDAKIAAWTGGEPKVPKEILNHDQH